MTDPSPTATESGPRSSTGAWQPGDPPHGRRFSTITDARGFSFEAGGHLDHVEIAYETWGELAADGSNAILVCHALTGDAHAGTSPTRRNDPGWWDSVIGPGRALDTNRWFVVCTNVLGGCQGSTGPASPGVDGRPLGSRFPVVTIRDMVRAQARLARRIGVERWAAVVGGSMGGMQALEWAVMYPDRVGALVCVASTSAASPLQIAWSRVGRKAVMDDPAFAGGDYYDDPDGGPGQGLELARSIAMIHYRSGAEFDARFGRRGPLGVRGVTLGDDFEIERYIAHHGRKLVGRFDANTYLLLNRAMDLHDIGRGRGLERALGRVSAPVLIGSIDTDMLYPPYQQETLASGLVAAGAEVETFGIVSDTGHDAFLIEAGQVEAALVPFLDRWAIPKDNARLAGGPQPCTASVTTSSPFSTTDSTVASRQEPPND